jgi:hypothetical protein
MIPGIWLQLGVFCCTLLLWFMGYNFFPLNLPFTEECALFHFSNKTQL